MKLFCLLLAAGSALAIPALDRNDDYVMDGSWLVSTVQRCTEGTKAAEVLEQAYHSCDMDEQFDIDCFIGAMGWKDESGEVDHQAIIDDVQSLPKESQDCLVDAGTDAWNSMSEDQQNELMDHYNQFDPEGELLELIDDFEG